MFIITMINGEIEWISRNEDTLKEWSNDWFYQTIPKIWHFLEFEKFERIREYKEDLLALQI